MFLCFCWYRSPGGFCLLREHLVLYLIIAEIFANKERRCVRLWREETWIRSYVLTRETIWLQSQPRIGNKRNEGYLLSCKFIHKRSLWRMASSETCMRKQPPSAWGVPPAKGLSTGKIHRATAIVVPLLCGSFLRSLPSFPSSVGPLTAVVSNLWYMALTEVAREIIDFFHKSSTCRAFFSHS